MNRNIFSVTTTIFIGIASVCLFSCNSKTVNTGMLVATEAPANTCTREYVNGNSWRYIPGARIVAFLPGKPESKKVLTENFCSAAFPVISYDGKKMLFTAMQNQGDHWEIWEMDLGSLKSRKITSLKNNCIDPVYLPNGKIVFSKLTVNDTVRQAHCLYTCNPDGSGLRQITFSPGSIYATTVLRDGRLLTVCRQELSGNMEQFMMVLRPDGTKADLFYRGPQGSLLTGRAYETPDGQIVFAESVTGTGQPQNITSIRYNQPLNARKNLTQGIEGDFCSAILNEGQYIVSYRNSDSERYSLVFFDLSEKSLGRKIFSDPEYDIIDVAEVKEHDLPRKLPSEVDMQVKTGLLLCQDINFTTLSEGSGVSGSLKAGRIEVMGVDTTYGVVKVQKDGSFYLKVMADVPFRIRTIDEKGNTVGGPCSWLWLRPNERRGCVGCHEDPELAPDNRVALAVRKPPVIIPVHISEVKEKIVELE
ncbi:MAG: hypothetical protein Q8868_07405 [Bacteroidota bacterium]|nr:hypothetical protein [Bacteroidota bacterium]